MLGTFLAVFMHFAVRDHLINFFEKLINQNKLKYYQNDSALLASKFTDQIGSDIDNSMLVEEYSDKRAIVGATFLYFTYELAAIFTF